MTNLKSESKVDLGRRIPSNVWLAAGVVTGSLVVVGVLSLGRVIVDASGPPDALPAPHYLEESTTAGVTHVYDGEFTFFVGWRSRRVRLQPGPPP